ncbi:Phosphomannomutase [Venturia inaequalis]|uniref:BTB domain-containing protein n=1 Tax=Venturia inaequalis TaxID=5025 RepID=A0A8H3VNM2_VENIN|nr:hypothetical protein EG327_000645 [Venturia inaequalis]RDI79481.1 Phosphomannomutase [Venturia inaequalis]
MELLKIPYVPYNQRDWSLDFTTTKSCSAFVSLIGKSGSKCQIYKSILRQRAINLWKMLRDNYLDDELVFRVEASEKTLLMFVNWIYSGEIRFLEFGGTPKPSLSLSCWHRSSIFVTACGAAMRMAKMGKSDLYANLDYQADMEYYDSCSRIHHQGTPQCHMEWLIELHLFAVKYDIDLLCEDALHALSIAVSVSNELPGWALVDKAYNNQNVINP